MKYIDIMYFRKRKLANRGLKARIEGRESQVHDTFK